MKKILENKVIIGAVCIVIAAAVAFIGIPQLYKQKETTVMICRLQADVAAGTQIEPEMLKQVEVGGFGLPETVVKNPDDLIGKYAKVSLTPDDYLYMSRFADYVADERLDAAISAGKRLMAVTMSSNAASVANQLKTGDRVTVSYFADGLVYIPNELHGIEVYQVENEEARDVEEIQEDEDTDKIAATVTLIVTKEQAAKLVTAEYAGKIHLLLESRGVN